MVVWGEGNVTSLPLVESLLLPSLVSTLVPVLIASRMMHGTITSDGSEDKALSNVEQVLTRGARMTMPVVCAGVQIVDQSPSLYGYHACTGYYVGLY